MDHRSWKLSCVALGMTCASASHAQFIFQRSLGTAGGQEIAYDLEPLLLGTEVRGFASVGSISQGAALPEIYATRTNSNGSTVWQRLIASPNSSDWGFSVRDDGAGGFLVSGETNLPGGAQIFVMRLNGLGNVTWSNRFGGTSGIDFPAGTSTRLTTFGSVTVGRRTGISQDPIVGVMIGVNAVGAPVFQRLYFARPVAGANTGVLSLNDVRATPTGYLAVGWTDYRQFGGELAPILLQTDAAGNVLNFSVYPFPGREVYGDAIAITPLGPVIACRERVAGLPADSMLVIQLDPLGNPIWTDHLFQFRPGFAAINYGAENRKIIIGGTVPDGPNLINEAAMTRLDLGGAPDWSVLYGSNNSDEGHAAVALPCGRGYALAGSDRIPGNVGLTDQYLVRTLATGRSGCFDQPYLLPIPINTPNRISFPVQQRDQDEFLPFPVATTFLGSNIVHCLSTTCPADVDDGSGTGTPDGGVTIDDLIYYLSLFDAGSPCADLDDGTGTGTPDGGVTIDDLIYFLTRFDAGC